MKAKKSKVCWFINFTRFNNTSTNHPKHYLCRKTKYSFWRIFQSWGISYTVNVMLWWRYWIISSFFSQCIFEICGYKIQNNFRISVQKCLGFRQISQFTKGFPSPPSQQTNNILTGLKILSSFSSTRWKRCLQYCCLYQRWV